MSYRSIWNGDIAWGLVSVPVKIVGSTDSHDAVFHQVHLADAGRVRYQKKCEDCGIDLQTGDIGRGVEGPDGKMFVVGDDELPDNDKEIKVCDFVEADSVDPLMIERTYFLQPGGGANKVPRAYRLLTAAMQKTHREAVVRFTLRSVERIGVLRVRNIAGLDVLALHMLFWADEIRQPVFPELDGDAPFKAAELSAAVTLVESLAADWVPESYTDSRQVLLRKKVAESTAPKKRRRRKSEPVVDDLIAKLHESAKKRRKIA